MPCQYPSGVAWLRRTGPRRAKSPALHRTRGRAATQNQQPHVRPDGGPTQGSPLCPGARGPAVPGSASRLPCIVGRAFTPAGGLAAHPHPLAGEALGRLPFERLPCKGSCRRQPTEGCGALPCQYLSGLPGNLTAVDGSRRAKSPALHCARGRAATQNQRPHVRPDGGPVRDRPLRRGRRPAVPGSASRLLCIVGRAFTPAAGPCGSARPRGRCQHRPLRRQGKGLSGFEGYL